MDAIKFRVWLKHMKDAGKADTDRRCAVLLGISTWTILEYKRKGTDMRTALACAALIEGVRPYGEAVRKRTRKVAQADADAGNGIPGPSVAADLRLGSSAPVGSGEG